jgi:hypothetical protein
MVVTSGRFEKHTERMISINSEEQARLKKVLGGRGPLSRSEYARYIPAVSIIIMPN